MLMEGNKVEIVIVNWNSGTLLKDCLSSILLTDNFEFVDKIFVVDNNSSDQSIKILDSNPKINLILNQSNFGFAKAANQGFYQSNSPYVLLLNPDSQLCNDTLHESIKFMNSHDDIDILGCQLYNKEGQLLPSCSRFPTPLRFLFDGTGLSRLVPKLFTPALLMEDWDHKSDRFVDQVMGAFMFIRKNTFEKIGYFDEQFFVYFEDVDFSKKLADAHGKTFFNSSIKATHIGKGTTSNVKAFRLSLYIKSKLLYSRKYFSPAGYILTWIVTFFIEPFTRSLFFLFTGRFSEIKETFKGYAIYLTKKDSEKS